MSIVPRSWTARVLACAVTACVLAACTPADGDAGDAAPDPQGDGAATDADATSDEADPAPTPADADAEVDDDADADPDDGGADDATAPTADDGWAIVGPRLPRLRSAQDDEADGADGDPACDHLDALMAAHLDALTTVEASVPDVTELAVAYRGLAGATGSADLAGRAGYAEVLAAQLDQAGVALDGPTRRSELTVALDGDAEVAWGGLQRLWVPGHFGPLLVPADRIALRQLGCELADVPFTLAELTTDPDDVDDAVATLPDATAWLAPAFVPDPGPDVVVERCADLRDDAHALTSPTTLEHDPARSLSCRLDEVTVTVTVGDITSAWRTASQASETVEAGGLLLRLARPDPDEPRSIAVAIDPRVVPLAITAVAEDETQAVATLAEVVERLEVLMETLDEQEREVRLNAPVWPRAHDAPLELDGTR